MNKKRIEQILRVLLLPFIYDEFFDIDKDLVCRYYRLLCELKSTSWNYIERREKRKELEKLQTDIRKYWVAHEELIYTTIDDTERLLDKFYPINDICKKLENKKFIERSNDDKYAIRFANIYLKVLEELAKSLLTFRNGIMSIRNWSIEDEKDIFNKYSSFNKVEIWNSLNRLIPTDILTVLYYFECGIADRKYLKYNNGRVSLSDNTLDLVLEKGIAENHMHFNVSYNYIGVWLNAMDISEWREHNYDAFIERCKGRDAENFMLVYAGVLRIFIMDYLTNREDKDKVQEYEEKRKLKNVMSKLKAGKIFEPDKEVYESARTYINDICWPEYMDIGYAENKSDEDILLYMYFKDCMECNTTSENMLLFEWLKYIKEKDEKREEDVLSLYLLQYLRIKNKFFSKVFQHNRVQGLDHFQLFFREASDAKYIHNKTDEWVRKFLFKSQMQNPKLKKLEIRITPDYQLPENINYIDSSVIYEQVKKSIATTVKDYLDSYKCCIEEKKQMLHIVSDDELDQMFIENNVSIPTLGIVFHFIKCKLWDEVVADWCWLIDDKDKPMPLSNILNMRKLYKLISTTIAELRNDIPYLGEYLVGIDAASSENNVEPWVFSPVYRACRNRGITKPLTFAGNRSIEVRNMGFTYHVGEDFRHIVSGLRHIDEVVQQFFYKNGDRIGHAVALGISIEEWVNENEVIVIPASEYLDNLLWIYGLLTDKRLDYGIDYVFLEKEIFRMTRKIYGDNISGITVDIMYKVYKSKFGDKDLPATFKRAKVEVDLNKEGKGKYFCKYNDNGEGNKVMWDEHKLLCTQFCPIYREKLDEPVWVNVEKKDIPMFKQLQKAVINNIERKGVIAEVNPTSNTAISPIKGVFSHYLTNLNNVESGDKQRMVMAMINSDDPGVMSTDVENEISYMYHKLLYEDVPVEKAIHWIDKIRQYGMDLSFIKNVKKPSVMLREIQSILADLDKIIY